MKRYTGLIIALCWIVLGTSLLVMTAWPQKGTRDVPVTVGQLQDVDISTFRVDYVYNPNKQWIAKSVSFWIVQGVAGADAFTQLAGETITVDVKDLSPQVLNAIGVIKKAALTRYAGEKGIALTVENEKPPVTTSTTSSSTSSTSTSTSSSTSTSTSTTTTTVKTTGKPTTTLP